MSTNNNNNNSNNNYNMELFNKWAQFLHNGRRVVGIKNKYLNLKIQTKNFWFASLLIISSSVAFLLLGLLGVMGETWMRIVYFVLCEIPFILIALIVNKKSYTKFGTTNDDVFKVNKRNYFSSSDQLTICIRKNNENNSCSNENNVLTTIDFKNIKYYNIVLKSTTETTKIGVSSSNIDKVLELLSTFVYDNSSEVISSNQQTIGNSQQSTENNEQITNNNQ